MRKIFTALSEPVPGAAWQAGFRAAWPELRSRHLSEGLEARPAVETVRAALEQHMPELTAIWRRLCELAGDDPVAWFDVLVRLLEALEIAGPDHDVASRTGTGAAALTLEGNIVAMRDFDYRKPDRRIHFAVRSVRHDKGHFRHQLAPFSQAAPGASRRDG